MPSRAFVDANILSSRTLRDWLFMVRNAVPGMFELFSSLDVIGESLRVVRHIHPDAGGDITAGLEEHLVQNLNDVLRRFPPSPDFTGADPDDRHVHAAAVACGAAYLLTDNPADFGEPDNLPYELYTADEFLCLVDDGAMNHVREVTRAQNAYWQARKSGGQAVKALDVALIDAGCPQFAERVRQHLRVLADASGPRRKRSVQGSRKR